MAIDLIVIGTSLGGLDALSSLLRGLPPGFPLPIAIVQHRGVDDHGGMIPLLQRSTALPVSEVDDKDAILPGRVYVAPPDYHLVVEGTRFALTIDGRVCHARPSIDVLFESAADAFGDRVLGVILTGSSSDGADGARRLKARGGLLLVQDPATAVSPVMPRSAIAAVPPDHILPLVEIPAFLEACAHSRDARPSRKAFVDPKPSDP